MNNRKQIFEERIFYYSKQRQTGIMASITRDEDGAYITIVDDCGKIKPSLQDVPVLIEMLKRLLKSGVS